MRRIRAELLNMVPVATHALAAILATLLLVPAPTMPMLAAAAVIGNLPDTDTTYSHIGRLLYPLARLLEERTGHRNATHSLAAVGLVATAAYGAAWHGWQPWAWWLWPVWYSSHLALDMIVGGKSGVPLLWPASPRFYMAQIEGGSAGEKAIAGVLLAATVITWHGLDIHPARILHQKAGTLDFALQDFREWEPFYHVLADIEATDNTTHQPITGTFEIEAAQGETLIIRDLSTGRLFQAGQRDEPIYIRRIVARRGPPRIAVATPTPVVTPEYMKIVISGLTDPASQILVHAGQTITVGQIVADLGPLPTPPPTPTPTATPAPDALRQAQAAVSLALVEAQATQAALVVPNPTVAAKQITDAARQLRRAQAAYDRISWRNDIGASAAAAQLQAQTDAYHVAVAQATQAAAQATAAAQTWRLRLESARLAATAAARLPTPRPAPPPTATPTPRPRYVRAMASGTVAGWRIARADASGATVEIYVAMNAALSPPGPPTPQNIEHSSIASGAGNPSAGQAHAPSRACVYRNVILVSVVDGDTLDARINGKREKIRLIGVDAPETTKGHHDCYGQEATWFTSQFLQRATICVETDIQERDKYGRLLGYVWDTQTKKMLNMELVEGGYARAKDFPPNSKYSQQFHAAELQAKQEGKGLWGACKNAP